MNIMPENGYPDTVNVSRLAILIGRLRIDYTFVTVEKVESREDRGVT